MFPLSCFNLMESCTSLLSDPEVAIAGQSSSTTTARVNNDKLFPQNKE